MKNLIIIEGSDESSLAYSYKRAFDKLNLEVELFSLSNALNNHMILPIGLSYLNSFIFNHFEPKSTIQKANVELTKYILKTNVDTIFCFTNAVINPSTIVYLRSLGKKVILIYPDAVINMSLRNCINANCFDYIFTYSKSSIEAFKLLGAKNVKWCPLAGDESIHGKIPNDNGKFLYDISFIGNYRPEREEIMDYIIKKFPEKNIKIIGNWKSSKSKLIKKVVENRHIFGEEYAEFINNSFISLNIIDHSNYPAANMRFFEIPTAGGLQLSSSCPEMENIFKEGEHVLYYNNFQELEDKIQYCFSRSEELNDIRRNAYELILREHLYSNRLSLILENLRDKQVVA